MGRCRWIVYGGVRGCVRRCVGDREMIGRTACVISYRVIQYTSHHITSHHVMSCVLHGSYRGGYLEVVVGWYGRARMI